MSLASLSARKHTSADRAHLHEARSTTAENELSDVVCWFCCLPRTHLCARRCTHT